MVAALSREYRALITRLSLIAPGILTKRAQAGRVNFETIKVSALAQPRSATSASQPIVLAIIKTKNLRHLYSAFIFTNSRYFRTLGWKEFLLIDLQDLVSSLYFSALLFQTESLRMASMC